VTRSGSTKAVIGPASKTLNAHQLYAVGSAGDYRLATINIPVGTG
jgi:hypothetical protein